MQSSQKKRKQRQSLIVGKETSTRSNVFDLSNYYENHFQIDQNDRECLKIASNQQENKMMVCDGLLKNQDPRSC